MNIWPLQFRWLGGNQYLFSNDSGAFFRSNEGFFRRYFEGGLTEEDCHFLSKHDFSFAEAGDAAFWGHAFRWTRRLNTASDLNYIILVPTLRCNLTCDYCQVSRAAETAKGFDWNDNDLNLVLKMLAAIKSDSLKVEFQGGEPLLRLDLLEKVRSFVRRQFKHSEFVICTNLQSVTEEAWRFLESPDTFISTSLDATPGLHRKLRTKSAIAHDEFLANLGRAITQFGPERVSALPTVDVNALPDPEEFIEQYTSFGFHSIFLRQINFQGFARKVLHQDDKSAWFEFYRKFVNRIIEMNYKDSLALEEFYLAHLIRRIVRGGQNNFVDLRNPNWLGVDYVVIDYDGTLYPTDEARMLSRVRHIDLSIGTLEAGLDKEKLLQLNQAASNFDDPDCVHCVYRPYCGLDLIDDMSRYSRVDLPRHQTQHCAKHMELFDFAFELLYSERPEVQYSVAKWLGIRSVPDNLFLVHR